jgi:hypothetical protein
MANFELVIWNDEGERCTVYSVQLDINKNGRYLLFNN